MAIARRLLSLVLALGGAALAVVGFWFAGHLGSSGTATFALDPSSTRPVLLEPSLLDRVDVPTTVRITPAAGQTVWVGIGGPASIAAVLGDAQVTRVTGVIVRDWALPSRAVGAGPAPNLAAADIWRSEATTAAPVTLVVDPATAPETYVITADKGAVGLIEVSWRRSTWFFQSLVVGIVGVLLAVVGVVGLIGSLTRRQREAT